MSIHHHIGEAHEIKHYTNIDFFLFDDNRPKYFVWFHYCVLWLLSIFLVYTGKERELSVLLLFFHLDLIILLVSVLNWSHIEEVFERFLDQLSEMLVVCTTN